MTTADNSYRAWAGRFAALLEEGAAIGTVAPAVPAPAPGDRTALIVAPHPDDEVIIGALPLRLQREAGFRIVVLAATLGSRRDRREARWRELEAACAALGFDLVTPDRAGLEQITPQGRQADPANWRRSVAATAALLRSIRPEIVFLPHADDWNQTHVGTHLLATEAMTGLACLAVETEYWGAMSAPNLMIESSVADVGDLVAALSLHVGEVARNPYHLLLPAWLMDNVRRGAELVSGQGGAAPAFAFATLYRLRAWRDRALHDVLPRGMIVGKDEHLGALLTVLSRA